MTFSSPGDLPNQEIKPGSPGLQADSLPSEPPYLHKHTAYNWERLKYVQIDFNDLIDKRQLIRVAWVVVFSFSLVSMHILISRQFFFKKITIYLFLALWVLVVTPECMGSVAIWHVGSSLTRD